MSSTVDVAGFATIEPQPARMLDGKRMMMRGVQAVAGFAFLLAAVGLWIAPGANWALDIMLFKLCASVVAAMLGFGLLQGVARPRAPKVEIDTIHHEVRLVRTRGRDRFVLDRCKFTDLTLVQNSGTHVQLWGKQNNLIAEVAATDRVSHRSLVTALRVAGKL